MSSADARLAGNDYEEKTQPPWIKYASENMDSGAAGSDKDKTASKAEKPAATE